jgi:hypothetical protein
MEAEFSSETFITAPGTYYIRTQKTNVQEKSVIAMRF